MTERNRAASLGRDTPTIIKQSDSGPAGITVALDNHLQPKRELAKFEWRVDAWNEVALIGLAS